MVSGLLQNPRTFLPAACSQAAGTCVSAEGTDIPSLDTYSCRWLLSPVPRGRPPRGPIGITLCACRHPDSQARASRSLRGTRCESRWDVL